MCFDVVNAKNVNDIKWFCKNTWLLFRFLSMTYGEEMAFLLNKSDMASSIGISVQAFDKWGVPPVERRGREVLYDVKTVLEIDRERRQHNQRTPDDGGELEERLLRARAELTEEQAVAQKLKNQVLSPVFSRQWRIARCGAYCWTLTVRAGRPPARLTALT